MPPREEAKPQNRKRKRTIDVAPTTDPPQPPTKRRKRSRRQRFRTPSEFWDNLSQVPLCRRALQEFNWRTVQLPAPKPPVQSVLKGNLVQQLKRFARHGGPSLRDIRVGYACPTENHAHSVLSTQKRNQKPFARRAQVNPVQAVLEQELGLALPTRRAGLRRGRGYLQKTRPLSRASLMPVYIRTTEAENQMNGRKQMSG